MLPVLIPASVVTCGWIIVVVRRPALRWRMALLTASLAVFFLSISIGLFRYHVFGINRQSPHDFDIQEQLTEQLRNAVQIIELGVAMATIHLLLAAWVFKRADDSGRLAL